MKKGLLFTALSMACMSVIAQPTPFVGCPDNNVAVVRQGDNSGTTLPLSIYNVNGTDGSTSLLSGPILNPANGTNLQINAVGLNTVDGFLYGLTANGASTTSNFYRIGANAVAEQVGIMPAPPSGTATFPNTALSFVNTAAGEMDLMGNYYFSGASGVFNPFTNNFQVTKLYIGKLASVSSLPAGTANLAPDYSVVISSGDANTAAYYASLTQVVNVGSPAGIAAAANTGLRDLVYNVVDNYYYSYVTFPDPANPANFVGQMIKVNASTGVMTSPLPYVPATSEVAGTLLDKDGNFLVLFTDGSMYKVEQSVGATYTGVIAPTTSPSGLPSLLRGDMASCGAAIVLPITLNYFNAFAQGNNVTLKWETSSEINSSKFIVERSVNGTSWTAIATINSSGNSGIPKQYRYDDINVSAKTVFYRLKFVDIDGAVTYSNIKRLSLSTSTVSLSFYPNPVKDVLYIESTAPFSNDLSVKVNDLSGRVQTVQFVKADINKLKVNIAALAAGVYFLQIDNGGNKSIQKIIKQ